MVGATTLSRPISHKPVSASFWIVDNQELSCLSHSRGIRDLKNHLPYPWSRIGRDPPDQVCALRLAEPPVSEDNSVLEYS